MLGFACFAHKSPTGFTEGSEGAPRIPSTAISTVNCLALIANSLDVVAVVDAVCELPIGYDGAFILLGVGGIDCVRLSTERLDSFSPLR